MARESLPPPSLPRSGAAVITKTTLLGIRRAALAIVALVEEALLHAYGWTPRRSACRCADIDATVYTVQE